MFHGESRTLGVELHHNQKNYMLNGVLYVMAAQIPTGDQN